MELEQLENCGCFCDFFGTLRVTSVNRPKKNLKVIRSFSKFACHHFIAKIGEVRDFECTFSDERALYKMYVNCNESRLEHLLW